jgi:hypothetical protein
MIGQVITVMVVLFINPPLKICDIQKIGFLYEFTLVGT